MSTLKTIMTIGAALLLSAAQADTQTEYEIFRYDNGEDYLQEGVRRIVTPESKMGYIDASGLVVIKPAYDFAYPFHDGYAQVCNGGKICKVNNGEYHFYHSNDCFFIDHDGKRIESMHLDTLTPSSIIRSSCGRFYSIGFRESDSLLLVPCTEQDKEQCDVLESRIQDAMRHRYQLDFTVRDNIILNVRYSYKGNGHHHPPETKS